MKKYIALLLLCLGLTACAGQPLDADLTLEPADKGYFKVSLPPADGETGIQYRRGPFGQPVWQRTDRADGSTEYAVFDENGAVTACLQRSAEGEQEYRYQGGVAVYARMTDAEGNKTEQTFRAAGILLTQRSTAADGSVTQREYDERGNCRTSVQTLADGTKRECSYYGTGSLSTCVQTLTDGTCRQSRYYESGAPESYREDLPGGAYRELSYLEDGTCIRNAGADGAGESHVLETYADGTLKYESVITAGLTREQKWNAQGYCTYCVLHDSHGTLELVGDENGKLLRCTENGTVSEDPRTLASLADLYGFAA